MNKSKLHEAHEELKKLRKPIRNVNVLHKKSLSLLETFAVKLTDHVGSIGFFLIIFGWTILWLGWNTTAPKEWRYDWQEGLVMACAEAGCTAPSSLNT